MAAAEVAFPPPPPPLPTPLPREKSQLLTRLPLQKVSLYVGDLYPEVTERELLEAFSRIAPIASLRLCRDAFSGKSLHYAYVNFFSHSHASKALACLNHTELMGKPMRIMWSERDPHLRKTGFANLFVKNLHPCINNARFQSIFCKFGTILSCKVAEEKGKSKGFGFVQFQTEDSAMAALNALHDTLLEGKKLYVGKFIRKRDRIAEKELKCTSVYVSNLGEEITENILRDKFSNFGKVCNVAIRKDGQHKFRGIVSFESSEEAKNAEEALNGALLGSRHLLVGRVQKKPHTEMLLNDNEMINFSSDKFKASNLYVKNLNISVDDNKLQKHFSSCGQVISAKVIRDPFGKSKGYGFVCFSTPEEARQALDSLKGTMLGGKSLYVAVAQNKEEHWRKLPNYYHGAPPMPGSGYFYHPNWHVFCPYPSPPYNHFPYPPLNTFLQKPVMFHRFSKNASPFYPSSQQGIRFPNHHTSTYSVPYVKSSLQAQNMNYDHNFGPIKIVKKKRGYGESSCTESAAARGCKSSKAPGTGNFVRPVGDCLRPSVENHQPEHNVEITESLPEMNNSDLNNLLCSPNSSVVKVNKDAQTLKEANSGTKADINGAALNKSVRSLRY